MVKVWEAVCEFEEANGTIVAMKEKEGEWDGVWRKPEGYDDRMKEIRDKATRDKAAKDKAAEDQS